MTSVIAQFLSASRNVLPDSVERVAYSFYWNTKYGVPISRRRVQGDRMVAIVATAHKVGSTWLFHMLRDLGQFERKLLPSRFMHQDTILLDDPEVFTSLTRSSGYSIYKSHSHPISYTLPPQAVDAVRFITIYRDPRDAIVSASFFVASLAPDRGGWGEKFRAMYVRGRIEALIRNGDFLLTRLEQWYRSEVAFKVRYEDLLHNPEREMTRAAAYLGLDCGAERIARVCERHSFKVRSGRSPGNEKASDFLRKGISGDWKNYFDSGCVSAFKEAYDGRWNRLLVEMGYESTLDW